MYIELTQNQFFEIVDLVVAKTDGTVNITIAQDFMSYTDNRLDVVYQYIENDKSVLWDCALVLLSRKYNGRITLI